MKLQLKMTRTLAKKVLSIVDHGLVSGLGKPEKGAMCVEAAVCFAMGLPHGDEPPCVSPAVRKLKIALNDAKWPSDEARAKGMRRLAIAQLGTAENFNDVDFAKHVSMIAVNKIVPRALRSAAKVHPDKIHRDALEQAAIECEKAAPYSAYSAARSAARSAYSAALSAARSAADSARSADSADSADSARSADSADSARSAADSAADSAALSAAYSTADSAALSAAYSAAYSATLSARSAADSARSAADSARSAADSAADIELSFFAEEVVQILISMKAQGTQWLDLTECE